MRVGGASNRSLSNIIKKTGEDIRAIKKNGLFWPTVVLFKNLSKFLNSLSNDIMPTLNCFKAYHQANFAVASAMGLNEEIAYRIGRACSEFAKPKTVVVGGDVRLTSENLKQALSNGLRDAGTDVLDIGLSGTEDLFCHLPSRCRWRR